MRLKIVLKSLKSSFVDKEEGGGLEPWTPPYTMIFAFLSVKFLRLFHNTTYMNSNYDYINWVMLEIFNSEYWKVFILAIRYQKYYCSMKNKFEMHVCILLAVIFLTNHRQFMRLSVLLMN